MTRLRRGPFKSRGPGWPAGRGEPSAPRASEELGAGAKVSSQLRPRAPPPPPPPPTPARGLGPALPRSPGPPPEAGPGRAGRRPQFHFGAWSLRRRPADPPAASPGPLASRPRPPVVGDGCPPPHPPPGVVVVVQPRGTLPRSHARDSGVSAPPAPHPRRRGCARVEGGRVRHLFGPGPGAGAQGQDESDSVLRQDRHRGALQGRPAARPRAHPAGAAALPEDPGPGEGRCREG